MAPPAKTWSSAACAGDRRKHTPTIEATATSQVFFMTVLHRGALLVTYLPAPIRFPSMNFTILARQPLMCRVRTGAVL
jgi:hypothetical protein